jgi:hypothetical protein
MTGAGFPHSDISGSKRVCRSPELFAAYRVLHHLMTPRHSSTALAGLITISDSRRLIHLPEISISWTFKEQNSSSEPR